MFSAKELIKIPMGYNKQAVLIKMLKPILVAIFIEKVVHSPMGIIERANNKDIVE